MEQPAGHHRGYWLSVQREHWVALAWGVSLLVLLVAGTVTAVWWVQPREEPSESRKAPAASVIPSDTPTATVEPTASAAATASADSTATTVTPTAAVTRAPFVAFRRSGAVWVAGEHGKDERSALGSASGPFAISPDGLGVAVADTVNASMTVVDLVTQRSTRVGPAAAVRPVWAPDSSWLVYGRLASDKETVEMVRVDRDGDGAKLLAVGQAAAIRPDGRVTVVAGGRRATPGALVTFDSEGTKRTLRASVAANSVAAGKDRVYYAVRAGTGSGGTATAPQIRAVGYDGRPGKLLVGSPSQAGIADFTDLMLSPDGKYLAYTESGDDGYSRIYVVRTNGQDRRLFSRRRDGYMLGWSATGADIIFVEGNAFMDEAQRVMAASPDGTHRRVIVENGGL